MDRAPLRPVPGRPSGPVSDAAAVRHVASALPAAADRDAAAFGLVALAGRPRAEVGPRLGLGGEQLSLALARARKELRRTVTALPGSGWCERTERLISDRLDGALREESAPRLDVHLRNCPRCVEHERRVVQATDALLESLSPRPEPPELAEAPAASAPAAALELREPAAAGERAEPGAAAPSVPARHPLRGLAVSIPWWVLLLLAVLLAIAVLALAVAAGIDSWI